MEDQFRIAGAVAPNPQAEKAKAAVTKAQEFLLGSLTTQIVEPYAGGYLVHVALAGQPLPALFVPEAGNITWLTEPPVPKSALPADAFVLKRVVVKCGSGLTRVGAGKDAAAVARPGVVSSQCPHLAVICTDPSDPYGWAVIHLPTQSALSTNIPNFATAWALLTAYADQQIDWSRTDPDYYQQPEVAKRIHQAEFDAPVIH